MMMGVEAKFETLRSLADRIDQSDAGACNNLGVLYHAQGLYSEAAHAFLRALLLSPRMRTAARNLELAIAACSESDSPVFLLKSQIQADPSNYEARLDLARLLRLLGRNIDALPQLQALLEQRPDDSVLLREFGLLEQTSGDLKKAQRWYERALAVDPYDQVILVQLAEVHYQRGNNRIALSMLDEIVKKYPSNADAHLLRSFVLGDIGMHEDAMAASSIATSIDPTLAVAHADLSLDRMSDDRLAKQKGTIDRASVTPFSSPVATSSGNPLVRYGLGLAFRQRGYFNEARQEFVRALKQGEDYALCLRALAELNLLSGEFREAQDRYNELLGIEPENAQILNELGVAHHQSGNVNLAISFYRKALKADPRLVRAFNNLGVAIADTGNAAAAREAFMRAVSIDPSMVRVRLNLARLFLRDRDPISALTVLRELLSFHPRNSDGWFEMAVALIVLGRGDEGRQALESAIDHDPTNSEVRYVFAELLTSLGDNEGALRETEIALGLSPVRKPQRLTVEIELQEELPDVAGKIDLLSLVASTPLVGISISHDDVESMLRSDSVAEESVVSIRSAELVSVELESVRGCIAVGDGYEAITTLSRLKNDGVICPVRADFLEDCETFQLYGDAYSILGYHGEALDMYSAARSCILGFTEDIGSECYERIYRNSLIGQIRSSCLVGNGADCLDLLNEFRASDVENPEILALVAYVHATIGESYNREISISALRRILRIDPSSAALFHFAGNAALELGDSSLAIVMFRRALTLNPDRPSPRVAIAKILLQNGDIFAAHLELVAALAIAPDFRDARVELASLHIIADRPESAVECLKVYLENQLADVEALVLMALALRELDRYDAARKAVDRARRFQPDNPEALWLDGLLLKDLNRIREARLRWTRLIEIAPSSSASKRARVALEGVREGYIETIGSRVA